MPKALKPLTQKQQAFISAFVGPAEGIAYKAAQLAGYANSEVESSRLIRNPRIQAELKRLRSKETAVNTLTRNKTLELLTEIATDPKQSASDRIKALDVRNKMNAEYLQRINVSYEGMNNQDLNEESAEVMRQDGWICVSPDDPAHARHKELLE